MEVGVDGLSAEVGEGIIGGAVFRVGLALVCEDREDVGGEFGELAGELLDGFAPVGDVLMLVGKEKLQDVDQLLRRSDGLVEGDAVVLVEDCVVRRLKQSVDGWVAVRDLPLDFLWKIVGGVLCLPEAVPEGHGRFVVEDRVGAQALLAGSYEVDLGREFEVEASGTVPKECSKGVAGVAFGDEPVLLELGEGGVVGLDWGVRGLQREEAHWALDKCTPRRAGVECTGPRACLRGHDGVSGGRRISRCALRASRRPSAERCGSFDPGS